VKAKEIPPESADSSGILELLPRFELGTSSLPTAMAIFFTYFPLVYNPFCFISFAFRHSLQTGFPYIPRLSVADYVVRNPCGTWSSRPEAISFQAKKVVKFKSDRLKPAVNSEEVSSNELHLCLQREYRGTAQIIRVTKLYKLLTNKPSKVEHDK
jgi:hypothetical protein